MKKKTGILFCLAFCSSWTAFTQTTVNSSGHGRIQTFYDDDAGYPGNINYTDSTTYGWSPGSGTFGGGTADAFTWSQILQYDLTSGTDQTAFNNATSFELSITNAPTNQNYSVYASTSQIRDFSPTATVDNIVAATGGANSVNLWMLGVQPAVGTTNVADLGTFSGGSVTISGNSALDTLLSDTTFDSTREYVYVVVVPETRAFFNAASIDGSVTAIPEPSTFALVGLSLLAGYFGVSRRRR